MYVYEELIDGRKLTEIINSQHVNVKYLPGCRLPDNLVCTFVFSKLAHYNFSEVYLLIFYFFSRSFGMQYDQLLA